MEVDLQTKVILNRCNTIIDESSEYIKDFLHEYMEHHLSHIKQKTFRPDDPYGEEDWDDEKDKTTVLQDIQFDLESLPISLEILSKLNLKNKYKRIITEDLPLSWMKFIGFNPDFDKIEKVEKVLIQNRITQINKELEYGNNFSVMIMAQLVFNKNYDDLIRRNEIFLKCKYRVDR